MTAEPIEGLRFLQTNKSFLGKEFMTWLWFIIHTSKHKIVCKDHGAFQFYIDDRLVLGASGGTVHEHVFRGGTPAYSEESMRALQSGKLVEEASFVLQNAEQQWMWSMRAEDLSIRSLRLPANKDAESYIATRIQHIQVLTEVIDELFGRFMEQRLNWKTNDYVLSLGQWMTQATI